VSGSRHNASSGAPRPTRRTPFKRSIAGRRIAAQDQAAPIVLDRRRLLVEELRAQHRGDRMVLGPAHRRQAAALPGDARIVHEQSELGRSIRAQRGDQAQLAGQRVQAGQHTITRSHPQSAGLARRHLSFAVLFNQRHQRLRQAREIRQHSMHHAGLHLRIFSRAAPRLYLWNADTFHQQDRTVGLATLSARIALDEHGPTLAAAVTRDELKCRI